MAHRVTLIPGDGIGPEVVDAARRAIEATGVPIEWDLRHMGSGAFSRTGKALPAGTVGSIRENGVALKGPVDTPVTSGLRNVNVTLRQELDLYANVRPCRLYPGAPTPYERVDLVVVRENTEDMYTGFEFEMGTVAANELIRFIEDTTGLTIREDSGLSIKAISESGSERIVRFAFDWARAHGRQTVTAGHKANIMKFSDGVFLEAARRVGSEYPDVAFDDRIIDALTMHLVQRPELFDVLVLPNLYGDIVSALCAGLAGGPGIAPSANIGDRCAVFEATHGTAPKYAGRNMANPMAMMLSGVMMLRHLDEADAADRLEGAITEVIAEGRAVTSDMKPSRDDPSAVGTSEVADAVIAKVVSR
ncbi:MAG: isocitrate/isopropylmalate dehydrogenase family protein [Actinomycetota bacterium]|nr:isocitrate/isopropylmalate dehydrogenase family protein [Actinomycetota bacterium]